MSGVVLGVGLSPGLSLPLAARPEIVEARRARHLMGTTCAVTVRAADGESAARAAGAALDAIAAVERRASTWREDSELSRANRTATQRPAALSPELADLLAESLALARCTGSAFDPSVGPLLATWDLRGAGRVPSPSELETARRAVGVRRVKLDEATRTLELPEGGWLELGAVGKGQALDRAARVLRRHPIEAALLDFGGQLLAVGGGTADGERVAAAGEGVTSEGSAGVAGRSAGADHAAGRGTGQAEADAAGADGGWTVAVADPRDRGRPAALLVLRDGSVATSAQSERSRRVGDQRIGHVLDPRTGHPVERFGSASVLAASAGVADALSTAALVLGPDEGPPVLASCGSDGHAWLVADAREGGDAGLELVASPGFAERLAWLASDVRLRVLSPDAVTLGRSSRGSASPAAVGPATPNAVGRETATTAGTTETAARATTAARGTGG